VPLNKPAVVLDTQTRSAVKDARRWVVDSLHEMVRGDLAETAELGIAELVTNAILHGEPPVKVRLRGTREHPRVEVYDGSQTPPEPSSEADDEDLLSTIGRGLGIVATCAEAWGADIMPEGKIVWFEPGTTFQEDPDHEGRIYDVDAGYRRDSAGELEGGLDVELTRLPVALYADFRRHYGELRRELRLLAMSHESDYLVAKSISELFSRFDAELRMAEGVDRLDAASAEPDDRGRIDVTLRVPASTPSTAAQMVELLELADEFCRAERLLSLATTPQQLGFQRWYLGEFVRQGHGEQARPWTGDDAVRRPARQNAS
jgi:anti-sigma regulatory factor (Ser/Thr protein kinase)